MLVGASICAVIALASALYCWHFVRTATAADGRVTQMVERQGEQGTLYSPVFSFRDTKGVEHLVHSSTASYPPEHQVGDVVRVLYLPERPQDAKIESFFSLWGLPFVTGFLAAFYLPLGLLVWHWPKIVQRFRPKPPPIPVTST